MSMAQKCRKCRSPLRPCKCQRARLKEALGTRRKTKAALVAAGKTEIARERARRSTQEAEEWARQYHSEERREWVGNLPCCFCGKRPTERYPSENHHTWTEGTGRKGPYCAIVPLCQKCHRRYHQIGKLSMLQQRQPPGLCIRPYPSPEDSFALTGYLLKMPRPFIRYFSQWEDAAAYVQSLWLAAIAIRD